MNENYNPVISIITVCYNAEATICQTIDSVLKQDYQYIEYIIIDGKSTDNTLNYIKQYEQVIIKRGYKFYFVSEKDSGIYEAMNKGIKAATGDWIHFRNSGDYFFDNEIIKKFFSSIIKPDTEILHGDIRVWDNYGYCDLKPSIMYKPFEEAMPFWHPATFVKSDLHKRILFDESYRYSGDYDFFFKCIRLNIAVQYLSMLVAVVDVNEGASITNRVKGLKENLRIRGLENDAISLLKLRVLMLKIMFRNLFKIILPEKYIVRTRMSSRKKNGWVLHNTNCGEIR